MSEVLVLIDAPEGKVTKPSLELLTLARRIGEPSAVVFGSEVPSQLAEYGAEKVYQLDMKKKTYTVVTFAELRKQMEDAMAQAKKDAEAARAHALKEESKAKAALRKACMLADPAAVILNADAVELAQDNPALHLAREVAQGVNKAVQDGIESAEG